MVRHAFFGIIKGGRLDPSRGHVTFLAVFGRHCMLAFLNDAIVGDITRLHAERRAQLLASKHLISCPLCMVPGILQAFIDGHRDDDSLLALFSALNCTDRRRELRPQISDVIV